MIGDRDTTDDERKHLRKMLERDEQTLRQYGLDPNKID